VRLSKPGRDKRVRVRAAQLQLCLAKLGVAQIAQIDTVEIRETQPAALRDEIRRQRIVAEGPAAEMRRQAADIGQRVDLDPEQSQGRLADLQLEWHPRQPQEAGGIAGGKKAVDKGLLDLVEIGLDRRCRSRPARLVRRLPLRGSAGSVRQVVAGTMRRMGVIVVMMVLIMSVMVMIVRMVVVMIVAAHDTLSKQQAC